MPSDFSFLKNLSFQKLDIIHLEKKSFKSNDAPLESFFYNNAFDEQERALNITEVALFDGHVVGYITICADKIKLNKEEIEKIFPGNPPSYLSYGATLIGRLDTDINNRGKGIAKLLIGRLLLKTAKNNLQGSASAKFLTVDSYTKSLGFYEGLDFQKSSQTSRQKRYPGQNSIKLYIDVYAKTSKISLFMEEFEKSLVPSQTTNS